MNAIPKLSTESIEVLYAEAHGLYMQGMYASATEHFRLLTIFDTKERKHWMGLGASLQMQKLYNEALKSYEMAALLDPADPHVHIHAADCYFGEGQIEQGLFALDCADRAISLQKEGPNKDLMAYIALIRQAWSKKDDD